MFIQPACTAMNWWLFVYDIGVGQCGRISLHLSRNSHGWIIFEGERPSAWVLIIWWLTLSQQQCRVITFLRPVHFSLDRRGYLTGGAGGIWGSLVWMAQMVRKGFWITPIDFLHTCHATVRHPGNSIFVLNHTWVRSPSYFHKRRVGKRIDRRTLNLQYSVWVQQFRARLAG